ncbi:uncharacterized protein CLAFUR5_06826 [Fulvia fulva]|uniref:Uncharacterized protein n=1 Tax=Passalora fulva TaxID=5499 RepID=A0A9Q8UQQ1_PASFU|nr:uncharacterized protein CLAFUR5_06826 [Fulvia fulva]KAK4622388.1 hypothetical protein CLAFUR0_06685 [Fulvia fulva]UJO18911.1 hypothetical protein CLAFUR5_06826 [Fulvia fulva]
MTTAFVISDEANLTIIYIVLFTFLDGSTYVFEMTYGINSGLSNTIFVGLFQWFLTPADRRSIRDANNEQTARLRRR